LYGIKYITENSSFIVRKGRTALLQTDDTWLK